MTEECDLAIVGAGILGLAVAAEVNGRRPELSVTVLEHEEEVGLHQTSHNSGVIHAGIYYAAGSLKARLCVEGARRMYELCEEHAVPHERCGKVIVARGASELPGLEELERRGRANGVQGLRRLDASGLRDLEPHCRGVAALHSPDTGVADFAAVARALARRLGERGVEVATGAGVTGVTLKRSRIFLRHARGELRARFAIFCAGAWSDRLAVLAGASAEPRIVPFRGAYLRLRPDRRGLVNSLIYPVPDPGLPFLGVHLTRDVGGEVLIGPTALLALAREASSPARLRPRDLLATLSWPGTWRMFGRHWRAGLREIAHAASRRAFVAAAAAYVPELGAADVEFAFAGVRAQAVARDGSLVDDFVIQGTERAMHLRNAPSPAATSSLAIARVIAERADAELR